MRVEANTSYVLHKRPYRETSLLLDVFSHSHGRVGLIARGARRKSSGQAVLLQPFRRLSMAWSGRGELGVMTGVESEGDMLSLRGAGLIAGFYVNELIIRLLHRHEAHPELFQAYESVLETLSDASEQEKGLRYFELNLLEATGFALVLDHDVLTGNPVMADSLYQYVSERGPSTAEHLPGKHATVHGSTLRALASRRLDTEQSLHEAKQLLRQELGRHLGDRPLASRALYQAYLRNKGGRA